MTIKTKYDLFETVFVKHDPEQLPWMVVSVEALPGSMLYHLCSGANQMLAYEQELTKEQCLLVGRGVN